MKCITLAVAGTAAIFANVTIAGAATKSPDSAMRLSQSECTNLWQQANPTSAKGLTKSQSAPYVTDFKAANPDGDTTIDANEWMTACKNGLVKSSSGSGASPGESGAAKPAKPMPPTDRY